MNNLGNNLHPPVANPKVFLQDLESAVVAAVPESTAEHIKWHRCGRCLSFRRKGKSCPGIDKAPNQPRGRGAIHARPRSGDPDSALVIPRVDSRCLGYRRRHARFVGPRKQFPDTLLQGTDEEIDLNNLLET